jgi:hypothetical protein
METMVHLSDQSADVMGLAGGLVVTLSSGHIPQDLGCPLGHAYWHHRLHRDGIVNGNNDTTWAIFLGKTSGIVMAGSGSGSAETGTVVPMQAADDSNDLGASVGFFRHDRCLELGEMTLPYSAVIIHPKSYPITLTLFRRIMPLSLNPVALFSRLLEVHTIPKNDESQSCCACVLKTPCDPFLLPFQIGHRDRFNW